MYLTRESYFQNEFNESSKTINVAQVGECWKIFIWANIN